MRVNRSFIRDQRGITLTEMLVAMVVLGMIMVPLGNAVIQLMRLTDETTRRLSESHDEQTAAAYFGQDVQSVGTRDWSEYPYPLRPSVEQNVAAAGGLYPCGGPGTPVAVVRLAWDDPKAASSTPDVVRVAYVVTTVGAELQLHRIQCLGSATPVSDIVLAHNLEPPGAVVSCTPSCSVAPATVRLTLTIGVSTVVLSGQRRQT
jgi:prepilin-type N-terminal cleavage/methylation domain-containing protein